MKITKRQLRRIIRENLLLEQGGAFTFSVIEDEDDGGPTVMIKGIGTTFQEMLKQMNGQAITFADGDVEQFNFSDHDGAVDAEDAELAMVRNGVAHHFVEAWAGMNGMSAKRTGAFH